MGEEVGLQSAQRLYPMDPSEFNDIRPDDNRRIVGVDREKWSRMVGGFVESPRRGGEWAS